MNHSDLKTRACAHIPSGVNSPVRAFHAVGGDPLFAESASGPFLRTVDGRELIDLCSSFGPMILGHADPSVVEAIQSAAARGTSYAVTTEAEIELAELLCDAIGVMDQVRLVNSGTEAVMTALRLARGATGRSKILKFAGCYHGHTDSMLVQAGSGVAGIAAASSAGVTAEAAGDTLVAPFNDLPAVEALLDQHGDDLAAIIVEPLPANMGLVPPSLGYRCALRDLADRVGALLIFDEVISGFRMEFGSISNSCRAKPDLITLGKIIGGGLPIGAVGGRKDLMEHLAPQGPVYQAGTLSGNPLCVAAGLATLKKLKATDPYPALEARTQTLVTAMSQAAEEAGVTLSLPTAGSLFSIFFRAETPTNFAEVMESDTSTFAPLFHAMLEQGVYLPPSPFETSFLSVTHDEAICTRILTAWQAAVQAVVAQR